MELRPDLRETVRASQTGWQRAVLPATSDVAIIVQRTANPIADMRLRDDS